MHSSVYDSDGFFERYQKLRRNPISLNELVEKPTMLQLLPDLSGKTLLDLGCGTGEHLQLYLQRGASFVVGVDLSQAMLAQATQSLAKQPNFVSRYRLYPLAMEQLAQLNEGEFDIITSSFAFHYVADFSELLQQIHHKLSNGGQLIFSQEHPITTCHKTGDRWQKEGKVQLAYRLNYYRDEGERQRNWFQQPFKTYHRTLAAIINPLIATGFHIEQLAEPMLAEQPQWHDEFKDLQHRPPLLFVKARKE